jgi:hypothetical protein
MHVCVCVYTGQGKIVSAHGAVLEAEGKKSYKTSYPRMAQTLPSPCQSEVLASQKSLPVRKSAYQ